MSGVGSGQARSFAAGHLGRHEASTQGGDRHTFLTAVAQDREVSSSGSESDLDSPSAEMEIETVDDGLLDLALRPSDTKGELPRASGARRNPSREKRPRRPRRKKQVAASKPPRSYPNLPPTPSGRTSVPAQSHAMTTPMAKHQQFRLRHGTPSVQSIARRAFMNSTDGRRAATGEQPDIEPTCKVAMRHLLLSSHVARLACEEVEGYLSRQAPRVQLESCAGVYAGRSTQGVLLRLGPSVGLYPAEALESIKRNGGVGGSSGAGQGGTGAGTAINGTMGGSGVGAAGSGTSTGIGRPAVSGMEKEDAEPDNDVKAARTLATRRAALERRARDLERRIEDKLSGMTGRQRKEAEADAEKERLEMRKRLARSAPKPNTQSSSGSLPGSKSFFVGEHESIVAMELNVGAAVRCIRFLTSMGRASPWFGSRSVDAETFVLGHPMAYMKAKAALENGLPPPTAIRSLQPWERPTRELCGLVGSSSSSVVTSLGVITRRCGRQPVSPLANLFQECAIGQHRISHVAFRAHARDEERQSASRRMHLVRDVELGGDKAIAPHSRLGLELEPLVREVCSTADAVHAQFETQVTASGT